LQDNGVNTAATRVQATPVRQPYTTHDTSRIDPSAYATPSSTAATHCRTSHQTQKDECSSSQAYKVLVLTLIAASHHHRPWTPNHAIVTTTATAGRLI
jgi:hypothetical protein